MTWSKASSVWLIPEFVPDLAERDVGGDAMTLGVLRDFIRNRHL